MIIMRAGKRVKKITIFSVVNSLLAIVKWFCIINEW